MAHLYCRLLIKEILKSCLSPVSSVIIPCQTYKLYCNLRSLLLSKHFIMYKNDVIIVNAKYVFLNKEKNNRFLRALYQLFFKHYKWTTLCNAIYIIVYNKYFTKLCLYLPFSTFFKQIHRVLMSNIYFIMNYL